MLTRILDDRLHRFAFLLLCASFTATLNAEIISEPFQLLLADAEPPRGDDGVTIKGTLRLRADHKALHQLSGLAWDHDEQRLYAVSDDGLLLHLKPHFKDGHLDAVSLLASYPLQDASQAALAGNATDAEGLAIRHHHNQKRGDTELIVSFEFGPRVVVYRPHGAYVKSLAVPPPLDQSDYFQNRNRQLEAITLTADFGFVTAAERATANASGGRIRISSSAGAHWYYHPVDKRHSGLVGMETINNNHILLLERRFISLLQPLLITLSSAQLPSANGTDLVVRELLQFDTSKGHAIDNFEGITKHHNNHYFMVSDDNRRALQRTLLTYLHIPLTE